MVPPKKSKRGTREGKRDGENILESRYCRVVFERHGKGFRTLGAYVIVGKTTTQKRGIEWRKKKRGKRVRHTKKRKNR